MHDQPHLAELLGQLLIDLLQLAGVVRQLGSSGFPDLGIVGFFLDSEQQLLCGTNYICWLARPATIEEKRHIRRVWGRAGEGDDDVAREAKMRYAVDTIQASRVINKRGERGNRWPEATATDNGFLSVNFLPLHSLFLF